MLQVSNFYTGQGETPAQDLTGFYFDDFKVDNYYSVPVNKIKEFG